HNIVISGWILDPDRKKMSKSRGNVITPNHLLEKYSSDALRYWAAPARLGVDTAYDEAIFSNGKRLGIKLFNAAKFVAGHLLGQDLMALNPTDTTKPPIKALSPPWGRRCAEPGRNLRPSSSPALCKSLRTFFGPTCVTTISNSSR